MNSPLPTAAIRKLLSMMNTYADQTVLLNTDRVRERKDEYRIGNHHRAHSPISCWLCFLFCLHSQCALLIRQLFTSYSESSMSAPLHPALLPSSIPHTTAERACTIPDYFPSKLCLVQHYHPHHISRHPPAVFCIDLFSIPMQSPIEGDNTL